MIVRTGGDGARERIGGTCGGKVPPGTVAAPICSTTAEDGLHAHASLLRR